MDTSVKVIKFGTKAIYLPKFTIALIRTPKLSPYHARFKVPLSFSKFDLRDYLFHAYNVRTVNVRSMVQHTPVRNVDEMGRQLVRPDPVKYMTVEMDKPFVWPENPESWEPWGRGEKKRAERDQVDYLSNSPESFKGEVNRVKKQAAELLVGKDAGVKAWEKTRTQKYITADSAEYKIKV